MGLNSLRHSEFSFSVANVLGRWGGFFEFETWVWMAKATMKAVKFHRQTRLSQVIEVGGAFEVQLASWWLFVLK